ncbi:MAG: FecR domain-containing protein [Pseudanabaenaceae cyanobacterium bins.68]|nr:FecR domain-containing protein [Pseudanabaenaceae cyanobacterium bins.68]
MAISYSSGLVSQPKPPVITQAVVTKILQGDQVFIADKKAKVQDVAKRGEQVKTGLSRAELLFNNQATVRLAPNSNLVVGTCGAQLQKGQGLFTGGISACTNTVTAAVRGTSYVIDLTEGKDEQINVLEGEIEVVKTIPDQDDRTREWKVKEGENCRIDPDKRTVLVKPLAERQFRRILRGRLFKGFEQRSSNGELIYPSDQARRKLQSIRQVYARLYPGKRFPIRTGPLDPNRGHFSLVVRQKRPLLDAVNLKLSIEKKRGESFLPEQLIGDYQVPLNQPLRFSQGLNPEDRIGVRIYGANNQMLGYTVLELLDEKALVNLVLPDVPSAYGSLRTVIGSDRNNQIDAQAEVFDYYTKISRKPDDLEVNFWESPDDLNREINRDFFRVANLPDPPRESMLPDSFKEDLFAIATRPNFPFRPAVPENLREPAQNPVRVTPQNSSFLVPRQIIRNRLERRSTSNSPQNGNRLFAPRRRDR